MNQGNKRPQASIGKGNYRHYKTGQLYAVIGMALHTETGELLVVYRPLDESPHGLFVRPYSMFVESVQVDGAQVPRFTKCD